MNSTDLMTYQAGQPAPATTDDLYTFVVALQLESGRIRAEMVSPERRLSDHLNGFLPTIDILFAGDAGGADDDSDLLDYRGYVTKTSLLFALPLVEPKVRHDASNTAWRPTVKRRCRAAVGRWTITGSVHFESDHVSEATYRLLDKQFLPITNAAVKENGTVLHQDAVVIVNRFKLDVLFVDIPQRVNGYRR